MVLNLLAFHTFMITTFFVYGMAPSLYFIKIMCLIKLSRINTYDGMVLLSMVVSLSFVILALLF